MSIKLEHVNYIYSPGTAYEKQALSDISLDIQDGEFVGLIGHTGSGKSTLIQHLNGLVRATSGALYVDGKNIYEEGYPMRQLRAKVGLVFQYPEYQLFEVSVLKDVSFGPKNLGLGEQEAQERAKAALAVSCVLSLSLLGFFKYADFTIETVKEDGAVTGFTLYGGGFGHGVGMSQNGARSMAESGCDWETILSYFYEGISLKRGDGL